MTFYDLPLEIKDIVLSYNLGDDRLVKIKNSNIIKIYLININQYINLTH